MIEMTKDDFLLLNIIDKKINLDYLQGIYVDIIDKCFIVTDRKTLVKRYYKDSNRCISDEIITNFFIPILDCKNMKKILNNNCGEIIKKGDIYYFLSGGVQVEMNIKNMDNYPDYATLISSINKEDKKMITLAINPSSMINILKSIPANVSELVVDVPIDNIPIVMRYDNTISLLALSSVYTHNLSKQDEENLEKNKKNERNTYLTPK